MKKFVFSALLVGCLSIPAFSHVDLIGLYVRINSQAFRCALISTKLCARVSTGGLDEEEENKPMYRIIAYNPDGTIAEEFGASSYTTSEDEGGTTVNYLP